MRQSWDMSLRGKGEGSQMLQVHHKIIDFNRDARQAGTGDSENKVWNLVRCNMCSNINLKIVWPGLLTWVQAITKLNEDGKLRSGANNDLILPQA